MKKIKKLATSSVGFFICLALCYLCGAFISQQFNSSGWSEDGRILYLFASFASGLLLSAFIYFEL